MFSVFCDRLYFVPRSSLAPRVEEGWFRRVFSFCCRSAPWLTRGAEIPASESHFNAVRYGMYVLSPYVTMPRQLIPPFVGGPAPRFLTRVTHQVKEDRPDFPPWLGKIRSLAHGPFRAFICFGLLSPRFTLITGLSLAEEIDRGEGHALLRFRDNLLTRFTDLMSRPAPLPD